MPTKSPQPGDEERRTAIGARIKETRVGAGIGLRQMARDLGMSPSWLLGVESGQNGIDAVRLADVARCLGLSVDHLVEGTEQLLVRQRQLMSRPATRLDWRLMYAGEEERARAHFELDRVFRRIEEERSGGGKRPAGGD